MDQVDRSDVEVSLHDDEAAIFNPSWSDLVKQSDK